MKTNNTRGWAGGDGGEWRMGGGGLRGGGAVSMYTDSATTPTEVLLRHRMTLPFKYRFRREQRIRCKRDKSGREY